MKLTKTQPLLTEKEALLLVDRELDVRGLVCPLPILRTKKALSEMSTGQVIKIVATDPGSVIDFQVFAEQTANELLSLTELNDEFVFYLKKR
ncbi:MAG: sulfurtransferase TusA family protein [Nitrosomonas sp.]|nr:sulfurtransferase TusA family protein [Nitrosomonas sp.]MBK7363958.1 sulfurtransferase TusA family protein [Nitrosomonas sp.]